MAAMYMVRYDNGTSVTVSSADAKSRKAKDITAAKVKARIKADKRQHQRYPAARAVAINCIG